MVALPSRAVETGAVTTAANDTQLNIETVQYGRLTWVNIEKPGLADIEYLRANYDFHPLDLEDCLSKIQRPKIDEYDEYLFLVLHFPVYNKRARVTTPSEVDIFIGEGYVITLHNGDLRPLNHMFKQCLKDEKARADFMGRSSGYLLYQIIDKLVDYCFPILNKIGSNLEEVEDNIFSETAQETVRELSIIRRDIIAFRRIVKPQIPIMASLEHRERHFLKEELEVYWGNISDHINKIMDMLEDLREVVDSLSYTNDSLVSHRTNETIKVLTIISTIMLPLAVISGIYGMNIDVLPFAHSEYSFAVTMAMMFATVAAMLGFFRYRKLI
ncbi:MAG: magnesium/cobalt transporter CorA [Chloroflexota bacterium]